MSAVRPGPNVRDQVLALAAAGSWAELCNIFAAVSSADVAAPELSNLRAEALLRSGRPRDAKQSLLTSMSLVERRGDRSALRKAINLLGAAHFETGDLSDAEVAFQRALNLGQDDHDDLVVARATNNLGAIANIRGEREQALAMYALAITAYQRLGQPRGLAETYHNMAITFRHLGLLERAEEYERRAIEFAGEASNPHLLLLARIGRAEISLLRGDARLAEATALLVAREFAQRSEPIHQAIALRVVGAARLALGDAAGARGALGEALWLARSHGAALTEAEILRTRAELEATQGVLDAARADAALAIEIFGRLHARDDHDRLTQWVKDLAIPPTARY